MSEQYLLVSDNTRMHKVGLGLWKAEKNVTKDIVYEAVNRGYRHIDCAEFYENEEELGEALSKVFEDKICKREDLWITTKLWCTNFKAEHVLPAMKNSLKKLKLDYLDLYLMHFPMAFTYYPLDKSLSGSLKNTDTYTFKIEPIPISETWGEMEKLVKNGLTKYIGVSNFSLQTLQDLLCYAQIKPLVLQVELHPYLTQENLVKFCGLNNILVSAYSPFGGISYGNLDIQPLKEPLILSLASKYQKSAAQIVLRWSIQRENNLNVLVKTTNKDRLLENIDVFSFVLTTEEVDQISKLNSNTRFNDPGKFLQQLFGVFYPIFN